VFLQNIPSIRIGGQLTKTQYQFTLQDADTDELFRWIPVIEEKARQIAWLSGCHQRSANRQSSGDGGYRSQQGLRARRHRDANRKHALQTRSANGRFPTIYTSSNQYWVILELDPKFQDDPAALSLIYVRSKQRHSGCR